MVALLADTSSVAPSPWGRRAAARLVLEGPTLRRPSGRRPAAHRQEVHQPGTHAPGMHPLAHQPSRAVLRRRRLAAVGLLAAAAMGSWIGLQAALGRIGGGPLATTGAPGGLQPAAARMWIVRPGDTLWSIAEAVDPRGDVRPLVDRMAAEAGSTVLYPGEPIAVPAA